MTIRCHVFTNVDDVLFLKQIPDFGNVIDGVDFTFGLDVPGDIDVLLVYIRATYSIPTNLPKERTIFVAGEPDGVHPFSKVFLNQFGIVLTTSEKELTTHKIQENYCSLPFVGINFNNMDEPMNLSHFAELECPPKDNRFSVVTSSKAFTDFQRRRLTFLEQLKEKIPDKLVMYGRGFKSIEDKKDAMLDHKYHLSLENGGGRFTWTEKMSDPLLCWSLPFYHGCENYHEDLPADAAVPISLNNVDEVVNQMIAAEKEDLWSQRLPAITKARELILTKFNLMKMFARLAKMAIEKQISDPNPPKSRLIRSERSLWPEPGCRGSIPQYLLRSTVLAIWPNAELRLSDLNRKVEAKHIEKRKRRIRKAEAKQD